MRRECSASGSQRCGRMRIDLICFTAALGRQLAGTLREALTWLATNGQANVGGQRFWPVDCYDTGLGP